MKLSLILCDHNGYSCKIRQEQTEENQDVKYNSMRHLNLVKKIF